DRGARAAHEAGATGVLVALGGDIATWGPSPADGWAIHVTDDHRDGPGAPGQTIAIRSGGVATSSLATRRWRHDGRTMHHILDPRSGEPVRGPWRTVSVAADTCADANIAATAAIVLGAGAPAWLAEQALPARLVALDGTVSTQGGWPS
ncbi:MAG: FAD:protein FMN transferase, partial [Solirubrobacteraceae bacterium]